VVQSGSVFAEIAADDATHKQSSIIKMNDEDNSLSINAFCLNETGTIVAACGQGPGEVRFVDDEGQILNAWKVDVKPESIDVAADGTILVGGDGKLFRFDSDGNELHRADSPHAVALRENAEQLREQAIAQLSARGPSPQRQLDSLRGMLTRLEEKQESTELNEQEEKLLKVFPDMIERLEAQVAEAEAEEGESKEPSEEAITSRVESMLRSKMRISSITSSGDHIFVATNAVEGYGYCIWKTDADFSDGELIVEGLRGCCGQMDVQGSPSGLYVAENSRFRVVSYDVDGSEVAHWGERSRSGIDGFSSCCNPMNVCIAGNGDIFTAESNTGRIKRFTPDGELVSYIGEVELVPGCKNVSIAVSPGNEKVYMLDLTRNHIVLMQPRPADEMEASETVASQPGGIGGFLKNTFFSVFKD